MEKILSIFEQKNFTEVDESIINYKYSVEDSRIKKMLDILHYIGTDPEERKKLDEEAYWKNHDENSIGKYLKDIEERDKKLEKQAEALSQQAEALSQKDETLQKQADEIAALKQQLEAMKK